MSVENRVKGEGKRVKGEEEEEREGRREGGKVKEVD